MVNEVDVTVRGHVGHDPTIFKREGRRPYVRLNVASTPRIRSRAGEWSDGSTQWFAVKLFGDLAENAGVSIRKGDAVLVRGRLEHEEYDTRDGERRWTAVIVAEAFGPDLRYASAHVSRNVRRTNTAEEQTEEHHVDSGDSAEETRYAGSPETSVDTSAFEDYPEPESAEPVDEPGDSADPEATIAARIA